MYKVKHIKFKVFIERCWSNFLFVIFLCSWLKLLTTTFQVHCYTKEMIEIRYFFSAKFYFYSVHIIWFWIWLTRSFQRSGKNISIMNREVNVRNNKAHKEEWNSILNSIICRYNGKVYLGKIYTCRGIKSSRIHIKIQRAELI